MLINKLFKIKIKFIILRNNEKRSKKRYMLNLELYSLVIKWKFIAFELY